MQTILTAFTAFLEAWVGVFFLYHALNAFYAWRPLPESSQAFAKFIQRLYAWGPLMTLVKLVEVLAGVLLVIAALLRMPFFQNLGLAQTLIGFDICKHLGLVGMILLAPLILVIVSSHLLLNFRRGYGIALWTLLPYLALWILYGLMQGPRWNGEGL